MPSDHTVTPLRDSVTLPSDYTINVNQHSLFSFFRRVHEFIGSVAMSLAPQRKHRKFLRDGAREFWPESVEKVFVEGPCGGRYPSNSLELYVMPSVSGLRQYWKSPWATYSHGRRRCRNKFLVDYLKEAGIERSTKQVASHVQVLRNRWKGEKGMSRTSNSSFGTSSLYLFLSFANQNIN